ncbi:conserved hypothetical protein [Acidothermus cellulolyticus 11B]|uniref:L,D-TPase catalytic domain-containing protein n=1 Tax=Acidothermus cellulolyticus (strain ATCC 43068 / DSM 8971 / 11B) TaxID=351607 RepID=A0LWQ4_ACIC1|nr:conserved hypothetical protein [Acidothermus cellulolyticus 11B]
MWIARAAAILAVAGLVCGCTNEARHGPPARAGVSSPLSQLTPAPSATPAVTPPPSPEGTTARPLTPSPAAGVIASTHPAKPRTQPAPRVTSPSPGPPLLVTQLDVGDARQVITVTSSSWTSTTAVVQTFEKTAAGWRAVFPAMPAHIGYNGFAVDKREGDGKTPAGIFGLTMMFGQPPNPGVSFLYRVPDAASVWVDDPSSPYYNTWQENAALKGEHLASPGYATAYAYAAVIAYNTDPVVPGKGSAIFLHVDTGGPTAGCVSVGKTNLIRILRWLSPSAHPVIVMAPAFVITRY